MILFDKLKNKRSSLQEVKDDTTGRSKKPIKVNLKNLVDKAKKNPLNKNLGVKITDDGTNTVKQSEVSKKAKQFTKKINKRRAKLDKDLDTDAQFKKSLKKAGGTGDIGYTAPDRKTKVAKRTTRAIKQGTPDPFKSKTKFSQKQFNKTLKSRGIKVPQVPLIPDPFGKGDTKGEMNVKGLEAKAFKKTQPKDVKLPKSFTDFSKKLKTLKTDVAKTSSSTPRTVTKKYKPTTPVKQSEVSKKAQEFTKKTNQARVEKISKPKVTSSKVPVSNNLFNRVKPKGDGKVKNSKGIGNKYRGNSPEAKALRQQAIDARSGKPQLPPSSSNIVKNNRVTSSDRPNKGFKNPIKSSPKVTTNRTYGPRNQFKKLKSSNVSFEIPGAKGPTSSKNVKLPQFSKAESPSFKLSPKGQKFASKIPKALRGKTAAKIGRAALKFPGLSAVAGVGLAAAGVYAGYKAFKNLNKKKDMTYKDFRSLSTPSDPNKGKIIHTRDIPKRNIKKGDVARFSSSSKIPKSSSAEFKSNYAYK